MMPRETAINAATGGVWPTAIPEPGFHGPIVAQTILNLVSGSAFGKKGIAAPKK